MLTRTKTNEGWRVERDGERVAFIVKEGKTYTVNVTNQRPSPSYEGFRTLADASFFCATIFG